MNKPAKRTISHYVYRDIIKYIEDKYEIKTRDYYGRHGSKKGKPWAGELEPCSYDPSNPSPPYADFWHWMIDQNDHLTNGSYIYFREDWRGLKVLDSPKCHQKDCNTVPTFVTEILELVEAEFGTEIYGESIWVDW